jgi:hypothetical protein
MEKKMNLLNTKVALFSLGIVAVLTGLAFAQKVQHISQVNQSGLSNALGAVGTSVGELPQYEVAGFPISSHQISVLGSGAIQEEPTLTPALTLDGMPASPHQIAVIGPRNKTPIN